MLIRTLCGLQGGTTPWGKVAKHPSKEHAPGFLSSTVLEGIVFEVDELLWRQLLLHDQDQLNEKNG